MPFFFGWKYWKLFGSWSQEAFGILCGCHCRWTSQSKGYIGGTLLLLLLQPTVGFGSIGVRSTTRNSFGFLCFIFLLHHILERERGKKRKNHIPHQSPIPSRGHLKCIWTKTYHLIPFLFCFNFFWLLLHLNLFPSHLPLSAQKHAYTLSL